MSAAEDKSTRARAVEPRAVERRAAEGKRSRRRDKVMTQVLAQASRLFAEQGYERTTLQDVADAAGLSRPNLYNYVDSKEELLRQIVEKFSSGSAAAINRVLDRADITPTAKLHSLTYDMALERANHPAHFRTLDRTDTALPPEVAKDHLENRRIIMAGFVSVIEAGIRAGEFRQCDARVAALSVLGMCNWVAWWFHPGPSHPAEPIADEIAANCIALVAYHGAQAPRIPTPMAAVAALQRDLDHLVEVLKTP